VRRVFEVDGLFDGARTIANAAIVVDGAEVAWVGARNAIPRTPQGERPEVAPSPGRFVMPGMINCHCHLTLDGEPNFGVEVRQSDALATLKGFRNARAALRAGVTTVRDLSANGTMVIDLGRAIERGILEGPRVARAGCVPERSRARMLRSPEVARVQSATRGAGSAMDRAFPSDSGAGVRA